MTDAPDPAPSRSVAVPTPADAAAVLAHVTGESAEPVVLEAGYGRGAFAVDTTEPLAVLVRAGADDAIREAAWLDWLGGAGFPVVELVGTAVDDGSACGLVVRRTDRSFVERIGEAPAEAPDVLRDLGALQARLHRLPTEGAPGPADAGPSRIEAVRDRARSAGRTDLIEALDRVTPALTSGTTAPVVGHGDLSPGNVRLDAAGEPHLASWADVTLAPAGWDVARGALTIWATAYLAPNRAHRAAMKMLRDYLGECYLGGYAGVGEPVPEDVLAAWDVVHACAWLLDLDAGPRPGDPWDPLLLVNDRKGLARDLARRIRRTGG